MILIQSLLPTKNETWHCNSQSRYSTLTWDPIPDPNTWSRLEIRLSIRDPAFNLISNSTLAWEMSIRNLTLDIPTQDQSLNLDNRPRTLSWVDLGSRLGVAIRVIKIRMLRLRQSFEKYFSYFTQGGYFS